MNLKVKYPKSRFFVISYNGIVFRLIEKDHVNFNHSFDVLSANSIDELFKEAWKIGLHPEIKLGKSY